MLKIITKLITVKKTEDYNDEHNTKIVACRRFNTIKNKMGKQRNNNKDDSTNILFKTSQHTIYTQSKTCSGVSQIHTRSGIRHLKKYISQTHLGYAEGNKMKKDFSVATDICILRRKFKKKKNRLSVQEGSKSKYSTVVDTEIDTIEDFQHNTSACGDSEYTEANNVQFNISKVMMDNFKYLLCSWIQTQLLRNKDTSDKLDSVLYSLLHRTGLDKARPSSSRSTYVLNRECRTQKAKKKKVATTSIFCKYCQNKSWIRHICKELYSHSTPTLYKNIKVISTLSVPKSLHKKVQDRFDTKSNHKNKKTKYMNVVSSINISSKLPDYSSFDLQAVSTKSFIKRCATYNCSGKTKKHKKKRHIVFSSKPIFNSATGIDKNKHKATQTEHSKLVSMPSLMKSIYADDLGNVSSTEDNFNFFWNDNFTITGANGCLTEVINHKTDTIESKVVMADLNTGQTVYQQATLNEQDRSEPMITIDIMNETLELSKIFQPKSADVSSITRATEIDKENTKNSIQTERRHKHRCRNIFNFSKKEKKRIKTTSDKKSRRSDQRFLDHCQNIFQYITDHENKNSMKLDINITVLPATCLQNKSTETSRQDLNTYEKSVTTIYNFETTFLDSQKFSNADNTLEDTHIIIPLLDGADNQATYIFKSESCSEKTLSHQKNAITTDHSIITNVEILDNINYIKSKIKDLTTLTGAFVKYHVINEGKSLKHDYNNTAQKFEYILKGIQFSKEISKHPLLLRVQLSKETNKIDTNEFYNRLMKKSTSYNIINSKTILRDTDTTSATNEIKIRIKPVKSLPNYRTIVEETNNMTRRKLFTHFCDKYNKNDAPLKTCIQKCLIHTNFQDTVCVRNSTEIKKFIDTNCSESKQAPSRRYTYDEETCYFLPEQNPVCRQKDMGFGKRCVYCLLFWISFILIAILFYIYVLKDAFSNPKLPAVELRHGQFRGSKEGFIYHFKLSDLGF